MRMDDVFGFGRPDCLHGGPVELENAGTIYRVQLEAVQIRGPSEDSGGDEKDYAKGEGKYGSGLNILGQVVVHSPASVITKRD